MNQHFAVYTSSGGNYFFGEIRDLLAAGLAQAGCEVRIADETKGWLEAVDWHIVIAPHEFFYLGRGRQLFRQPLPQRLVIFNTEQPSTKWFELAVNLFAKARYIWDMNYWAAQIIAQRGFAASYLPLGYVPDFALLKETAALPEHYGTLSLPPEVRRGAYLNQPWSRRPLDVMFLGNLSPRREAFFSSAASLLAGYHTYLHFSDPGRPIVANANTYMNTATVVGLTQRTKILLNIHRGDDQYFEWHRIVMLGIWQKLLVISEPCIAAPPFEAGRDYVEAPAAEIPERIRYYLSSPAGQQEAQKIVEQSYITLTQSCQMRTILQPLLAVLQ